jgi:hypothetical protein
MALAGIQPLERAEWLRSVQRVCCVRRWCSRRILSRLPQVDIEHQRRRPLVLRNSHPQPCPGQRLTREDHDPGLDAGGTRPYLGSNLLFRLAPFEE